MTAPTAIMGADGPVPIRRYGFKVPIAISIAHDLDALIWAQWIALHRARRALRAEGYREVGEPKLGLVEEAPPRWATDPETGELYELRYWATAIWFFLPRAFAEALPPEFAAQIGKRDTPL